MSYRACKLFFPQCWPMHRMLVYICPRSVRFSEVLGLGNDGLYGIQSSNGRIELIVVSARLD